MKTIGIVIATVLLLQVSYYIYQKTHPVEFEYMTICIDDVEYLTNGQYLTPHFNQNSRVIRCQTTGE